MGIAIPMVDALCWRSVRAKIAASRQIVDMHPDLFRRFAVLMRLGLPAIALTQRTFAVEGISQADRVGGWFCLAKGAGHMATGIGWPVRLRDGDAAEVTHGPDTRPIVGHAVAGQDRDGDLWALLVMLEDGEDEYSASFHVRCREARQTHGVDPTVLHAAGEATEAS